MLVYIPVAGGANFSIQIQLDIAVVEHHRQLSAARVEVEATQLAVINEPRHSPLARVAATRLRPRRPAEELEGALGVEGVGEGRGGDGAVRVKVEVAGCAPALVGGADAHLLAAVAFERRLRVAEFEGVVGMAPVGDFLVLHA